MEKYCVKCKAIKDINKFYLSYSSDRKGVKISSYCKICTLEEKRVKVKKEYKKICLYCKKEFIAHRIDRTCCNESHRNMWLAKENNVAFLNKLARVKQKHKCRDKYGTKLNKRDKKYIFNMQLTAKEVVKKIKRPISTIYTLRSKHKEELLYKPKAKLELKIKLSKEEKILYWNEKLKDAYKTIK